MILDAVAVVLITVGAAFVLVSSIGLLRLPDFYLRAHAVAKSETVGIILVLSGLVVHERFGEGSVQMVFIMGLLLVTTPTAVHAMAEAASQAKVRHHDNVGDAPGEDER